MTTSGPLQSGLVSLNGLKVKQTKIRRGYKKMDDLDERCEFELFISSLLMLFYNC